LLTPRQKLILSTLATADRTSFAPVQVQKIFFLIDNNIQNEIGGAQFSFAPYDYGPFDKDVYRELNDLSEKGLVSIENPAATALRKYSLTDYGVIVGKQNLSNYSPRGQKYMSDVVAWVCRLSFAELVGAIYAAYPDMKTNSVFK